MRVFAPSQLHLIRSRSLRAVRGISFCIRSPDTAKEAWPCVRPVCGSPFDDSSCAGLGSRCPGFLTDLGAQTVMLACTQQECDPDHMQTMYSACCPASGRDAWPCDTPQCDSEECLNELTFMAQVCPLALLNDDGVTQTLQKCQQVQDAAVAAGVDDAAQQECETNNRRAISDMHRACCPQGWPCACNPAVTPCVSVDSTGLQCGQEETECLGLLNALVTTDCSSLLFDPQIQAVAAECSNRGIATAAAPPTVTGGRGAQSGRGGNGRPGNGRGGMRSGQQSIAAPAPPPTGGDDAGDGGGSIGLLVGGLLVIAVAGAAYVKTKGKSGGAGRCRRTRCHFAILVPVVIRGLAYMMLLLLRQWTRQTTCTRVPRLFRRQDEQQPREKARHSRAVSLLYSLCPTIQVPLIGVVGKRRVLTQHNKFTQTSNCPWPKIRLTLPRIKLPLEASLRRSKSK